MNDVRDTAGIQGCKRFFCCEFTPVNLDLSAILAELPVRLFFFAVEFSVVFRM